LKQKYNLLVVYSNKTKQYINLLVGQFGIIIDKDYVCGCMSTKTEVEQFLIGFKTKLQFFGVIYTNRDKNLNTLIELELTAAYRREVLEHLNVEDYYKGPTKDYDNGPSLWEFGKTIKQRDVYIKITLGADSKPVICISFHIAERPIKYPLK
jgi:hypothetical protein